MFWLKLIRVASAAVRISPVAIGAAVLGYLGFDFLKKNIDLKPEKGNFDYDLHEEAQKNKDKYTKEA